MRKHRAKEERIREKRIDAVNDRQLGKLRSEAANIDVMSTQQFPIVS